MGVARTPGQSGFTLIELMITVAIIGVLASIALGQYRDYTRRARMSEVVLAATRCKTSVSESYLSLTTPPTTGAAWGCETGGETRYVAAVQTSPRGVIRVKVDRLDAAVNGLYVYLVPLRANGSAPMDPSADLGNGVGQWVCGSDVAQVRSALPANCREDTAAYAAESYE